ncbi:hypothetical protein A8C32_03945 [Flavivirga aquatica]|uniref:Uncharacterized protein n=1 Tax=Flavivirga aquatica TaxID=1849968 RepID=A0A1E5TB74_9FLAO|nr:hypothetical protein [Flavivirga aquatica]OEK08610.1 hypothetical protein A8C32_03945 [Flavivirga aquatica]
MDMWLEEDMQEEIDLAKLEGLEAVRMVINSWHHDLFTWDLEKISNETANKLLQGDFNTFDDLLNYDSSIESYNENITILFRRLKNENKEIPVEIIESIFEYP